MRTRRNSKMVYEDDEETLPYTTIGTDEAKKMIEAGTRVIDVRQPAEWDRGHIAEAELVPLNGIYAFGKALKELNLPADEDVIFVCASGQRSAAASEIALVTGLQKVYNLANGMNGWVNRQYPIER
ncbi:rhodanese-like domain-containing protein [Ktedonosporobacter rubrisoli]|uniref:Rhodanese-like domain-containing protein n=2 Tax=Ktedonosporobacter rubrisoli TaxID=2509675 RepID=A0A4V0YZQ7_KTERU|nr:rhodanese-like domain-containing protein [Ktedonosporobacter rubrisoli]